jgi:uncharacterized phage protein (TIGR01671 family)
MRTIKFRGKRLTDGKWVYGSLVTTEASPLNVVIDVSDNVDEMYHEFEYIDPDTVGQFTGLYDVDGKEIYEGDIVERFTIYVSYEQVGNYPPPNIEVREWDWKRDVDEVYFESGSFIFNGLPVGDDEIFGVTEWSEGPNERWEEMLDEDYNNIRTDFPYLTSDSLYKLHVIGNVYDNKEILED